MCSVTIGNAMWLHRDLIKPRPALAATILFVGAVIHFFLCWPLYGRRGFPELHPFYLAMIWLWMPAIPISVLFCKCNHRRCIWLTAYIMLISFSVSWGSLMAVPSYKPPLGALFGMVFYIPAITVGVIVVEGISRLVCQLVREFTPEPVCRKCGYSILYLKDPRCPECGTPFDPMWLVPDREFLKPPGRPVRTAITLLVVITGSVLYPNAYANHAQHQLIQMGRADAQQDWQNGEAAWLVTKEEEQAMSTAAQNRYMKLFWQVDAVSGLEISPMRNDWRSHTWGVAYRMEIERLLAESGQAHPSFETASP
jgi:hypothetical protein